MANFSKSFNFRNGLQVDNDKFIVKPTTGLVGIASIAPTEVLDVVGNIKATGITSARDIFAGAGITVGYANSNRIMLDIDPLTGVSSITAQRFYGDGSNMSGIFAISVAGFVANSTNGGILTSFRKVGIGVTTPTNQFEVEGDSKFTGVTTFVGVSTADNLFADAFSVSNSSKFAGGATIDQANVTGVSTFTGISTSTSLIQANGLEVAGVSTFGDNVQFKDFVRFGKPHSEEDNVPGKFAVYNGNSLFPSAMVYTGGHLYIDPMTQVRFGKPSNYLRFYSESIGTGAGRGQIQFGYSVGENGPKGLDIFGHGTLSMKVANKEAVGIGSTVADVSLSYDGDPKLTTNGIGVTIFNQLDTTNLNVSGASTFNDAIDASAGATLNQLNITGVSTLTGRLTATEINSAAGNQVKLLQGGTQVFNTIGAGVSVFNSLSVGSLNGGTSGLSTHTGQLVYGSEGGLGNYGTRRSLNLVNTDYGNINFILNLNNLKDDLTNTGAIDRTGSFIWHKSTGTQLMTLTGIGGSLGIGITTPDSPLHVAGDAKFGNDVTIVNDLVIGNDLNVTGGTINANVIGDLEGNVYAQTGVSTFANVVFADDLTVSGTTFSASFGANTSSMLTVKPTNQATGGEGTIIRAVAGSNNYYLSNDGFVGIRTSDKFSNIIVNGSNANAVFQSFGVGSYDHFQSTQLQRGAVDFANAGVSTQRYMVPPKVTTTERNALSGLVEGAMIYNTNNNRLEIYTQNSNWVGIATVA